MISIQVKALIRWAALAAVLVALKILHNPPTPVAGALWGMFGALLLSAFVWPRCPHCGARVVQFNKREFVPGQFCWRCHQPYDEIRTPAYALDLDEAVEEAEKLRQKDPQSAERLLQEAEARYEAAYQTEKTHLREKAQHDIAAARVLSVRLRQERDGVISVQKLLRKSISKDPAAQERLERLDSDLQSLDAELRSLDEFLLLPQGRK
jgi:hypothetical protein